MEGHIKKGEINSASISGNKLRTVPKIYGAENALLGQKSLEPVSIAMQQFIKNEFSKIKL